MKRKSLLASVVVVMLLALVLGASAAAGDCGGGDCGCAGLGCTPGYWKQSHHFGNWVGYSPDSLLPDVFDTEICGETMLDALKAKGPGSELCRHGAAALLNESAFGDDYPADDIADVIWAIQEGRTDLMVEANEAYCPLGRAELEE